MTPNDAKELGFKIRELANANRADWKSALPWERGFSIRAHLLAFMVTAFAGIIAGNGERIERVKPSVTPAWQTSSGAYIEVTGTYIATGDASVVLRMADDARPLVLLWDNQSGFQIGGLPRDVAELNGAATQKTVAWKLSIRDVNRETQRVKLETQNAGTWQLLESKEMVARGLREWVEERDAVLTFGLAGDVTLDAANVRLFRAEGTLLLVK